MNTKININKRGNKWILIRGTLSYQINTRYNQGRGTWGVGRTNGREKFKPIIFQLLLQYSIFICKRCSVQFEAIWTLKMGRKIERRAAETYLIFVKNLLQIVDTKGYFWGVRQRCLKKCRKCKQVLWVALLWALWTWKPYQQEGEGRCLHNEPTPENLRRCDPRIIFRVFFSLRTTDVLPIIRSAPLY